MNQRYRFSLPGWLGLFLMMSGLAIGQPAPRPAPATRPVLSVATIMQDPKQWVGTAPSGVFWSDDSRTVYFNWNPDRAKSDSLYKITLGGTPLGGTPLGGKPVKVALAERQSMPGPVNNPLNDGYNRARTLRLFEKSGDLRLLDIRTGTIRALTNTVEPETEPQFSLDEQHVIFRRAQNLYRLHLTTGELTQLTDFRTGTRPAPAKTTDADRALQADQLRLSDVLRERKARRDEADRITKAERPRRPKEVYIEDKTVLSSQLSPNGLFVTFRLSKSAANVRQAQVPNYVTQSGYTEEIPGRTKVGAPSASQEFMVYDIAKDTVRPVVFKRPPPSDTLARRTTKTDTAKTKTTPAKVVINGPIWSADGQLAVVVVRSLDNKDRWLMRLDPLTLTLSQLDHQHDDAWIGGPGIGNTNSPGNLGFLADNHTLWFQSEADGYSHLYTVDVLTGKRQQLTSGQFEVQQATLSRDKQFFYLHTNEVHPGEQHLYRMAVTGGPRQQLTTATGANEVTLSPDESRMLVRHSTGNRPWELFLMDNDQVSGNNAGGKKPKPGAVSSGKTAGTMEPLTHSTTPEFDAYAWREPQVVTIKASDSAMVYARLFRPDQPTGKAVVFVHGAGYLQNAHKWWSQYYREYMFHNLLVDKGYTVLDIDYRGSAGYGRDWRTGIYRHMGGKDLTDHVDAANWLVTTQGIDPKRIGIYGGSYGGFITLMAMFTTPDVFKAGAALRPVTDWAAYNHPYTSNILNEPQTDTLAYRRSSPIFFADGLKNHLLICHGMIDVNVHFQDSARLVQRLIELKKENWELAMYPLEDHGFIEPSSWTDEYRRILKLFEERL